jgi:hypothetical protein
VPSEVFERRPLAESLDRERSVRRGDEGIGKTIVVSDPRRRVAIVTSTFSPPDKGSPDSQRVALLIPAHPSSDLFLREDALE